MEQYTSPLQKYRREPKLYVDLPSKGEFYPPMGTSKVEELPVYSMTPSDEMAVKTPDALFNGAATVKVIQNCIPDIKNAWVMPVIDVDFCLTAIRLASYGKELNMSANCSHCGENNEYAIDLQNILEYFNRQEFNTNVEVEGFTFVIRPLTYKEFSDIQKRSFVVQRQIAQHIPNIEDDETRDKETSKLYEAINQIRMDGIISSVTKIVTPEFEEEENSKEIKNFIEQSSSDFFNKLVDATVSNRDNWAMPSSTVTCGSCEKKFNIDTDLDYSNFFVRG